MKRFQRVTAIALIAAFALMFVALLGGCALLNKDAAPADKVAALEATFTATVTALTDLRQQGKLDDTSWAQVKQVAEGIDASFDAVHENLDAGTPIDVDVVLDSVRAAMKRLTQMKTEAEREPSSRVDGPADRARLARNAGQGQVFARAA